MSTIQQVTQADAVYASVVETLAEYSIVFETGMQVQEFLNKEIRAAVKTKVLNMFANGLVRFSDQVKLQDTKYMSSYVSGLITNWTNKDRRLNGGTKYQAKNPGSRPVDATLKAMLAVQARFEVGSEEYEEIQKAIEAKNVEISNKKTTTTASKLDVSALPEDLRHLLAI
jgi:hypothetical protein